MEEIEALAVAAAQDRRRLGRKLERRNECIAEAVTCQGKKVAEVAARAGLSRMAVHKIILKQAKPNGDE